MESAAVIKLDGESYRHAAARHVVANWLREGCQYDDYHEALGFRWRVNRGGPLFGVIEEVPLVIGCSVSECGFVLAPDECGLTNDDGTTLGYGELAALGKYPDAILDIGIQHKGNVIYGIEICASHPVGLEKAILLEQLDIEVIELSADWVLAQLQRPEGGPGIQPGIVGSFGYDRTRLAA